MNTYTTTTTSSSFIGAGRQPIPTLPVHIEAADSLTGSSLKRVRAVNGKVGQDMLEHWKFNTVHTNGGPSNIKRVRTINKRAGKEIVERRKARAGVKAVKPSLVSSVLKAFKKIASLKAPTSTTSTTHTISSQHVLPSTPKQPTQLFSPPPLEYKKRTRVLKTTGNIEPIKLFYGPLFEGDKKARVQVLEISDDALDYAPKLWVAVRDC